MYIGPSFQSIIMKIDANVDNKIVWKYLFQSTKITIKYLVKGVNQGPLDDTIIQSSLTLIRLGGKTAPWYILFYNFLVTYPNFMKFGDFSIS